jgi:hypothetical protein
MTKSYILEYFQSKMQRRRHSPSKFLLADKSDQGRASRMAGGYGFFGFCSQIREHPAANVHRILFTGTPSLVFFVIIDAT